MYARARVLRACGTCKRCGFILTAGLLLRSCALVLLLFARRRDFASECLYGDYKPATGDTLQAGTCVCEDGWFGLPGKNLSDLRAPYQCMPSAHAERVPQG